MRIFMAVVGLFILAACQTTRVPAGPPEYQDGFKGGCDSGYVAANHPYYRWNKDPLRYERDRLYRQGWEDGFRTCKGQYDAIGR